MSNRISTRAIRAGMVIEGASTKGAVTVSKVIGPYGPNARIVINGTRNGFPVSIFMNGYGTVKVL